MKSAETALVEVARAEVWGQVPSGTTFTLNAEIERMQEALDEMRTYARHFPLCGYGPTYPESPVATCDCGFDAVLTAYEGRSDG